MAIFLVQVTNASGLSDLEETLINPTFYIRVNILSWILEGVIKDFTGIVYTLSGLLY